MSEFPGYDKQVIEEVAKPEVLHKGTILEGLNKASTASMFDLLEVYIENKFNQRLNSDIESFLKENDLTDYTKDDLIYIKSLLLNKE